MAIANIFLEKGDYEQAIQYYLFAKSMDETLEYIALFIAVAKFKIGDKNEALTYLQKDILKDGAMEALLFALFP